MEGLNIIPPQDLVMVLNIYAVHGHMIGLKGEKWPVSNQISKMDSNHCIDNSTAAISSVPMLEPSQN